MDGKRKKAGIGILSAFLFPGMFLFVCILIVPGILAVVYAFFDWSNIIEPRWIGGANFARLITDRLFWQAAWHNLKLAFYTLIGQVGLGYLFAFLLTSPFLKLRRFHRTVMFFPVIISAVVMGVLWMLVYHKDYGILNTLLRSVGLDNLTKAWLSAPDIVIEVLSVPLIWQWFGFYMIISMGAISTIPAEVLESADIDGCGGWQRLIYISVPMTFNTIGICVMVCVSGIMKVFDHVMVMTGGGPGNSSMVLAYYAYNTSFMGFQIGYGNAISVGTIIIGMAVAVLSRGLMQWRGKRYE